MFLQLELRKYSPALLQKQAIVVANKIDLLDREGAKKAIKDLSASTNLRVLAVSAKEDIGVVNVIDVLVESSSICST
jgi:GTPase involved in cell partitioning and DNA repair